MQKSIITYGRCGETWHALFSMKKHWICDKCCNCFAKQTIFCPTQLFLSWGFLLVDNTSRPYSSCGVLQRWMLCICLCGACACMLTDPCNGISPSLRAWGWSQAGVFLTVRGLRWIIRLTKGTFCSVHTHTWHSLVRDLLYIGHQQAIDRRSRALRCDEVQSQQAVTLSGQRRGIQTLGDVSTNT